MHVEIEAHIQSALGAFVQESNLELDVAARQAAGRFRNIEIVPCPFPEDGQFSTSFPIKFHSVLTAQGVPAAACSPTLLAEWFSRRLEQTGNFGVVVGGPGHLNISIEPKLALEFTRALLCDDHFFENIHPISTQEPLGAIPPVIPVDLFALSQKSADVEGSTEVLRRFRDSGNPDDALMLVFLATDVESDAGPYLSELKSSQNWPWFLRRVQSIARELQAPDVGMSRLELLAGAVTRSEDRTSPCMQLMGTLAEIRSAFYQARRFRGVNRIAPPMLRLARQFSSVYNRPESRDTSTAAFKTLSVLSGPTHRALCTFLAALSPSFPSATLDA